MLYIVVEAIALAKEGEGPARIKKSFFLIFYKKKLEYPLDGVKNLFYYCARPKRLWMISSVGRAADS